MTLPRPRIPIVSGWRWAGTVRPRPDDDTAQVYYRDADALKVLSSVHMVESNRSGRVMPHYHVSATHRGYTVTDQQMEEVRAAFDMGGAEEDNHGHGVARHLWLEHGYRTEPECACKQDEERTVEGLRVRHDAKRTDVDG